MKISGSNNVSSPSAGSAVRSAGGSGFALPRATETSASPGAAPTHGVSGVGSLDALITLQAADEPLGRRRRAIRRAGRLLDELDQLKLALLDGGLAETELRRLADAVREQREGVGDPGLESLLDQIETRAAVELAKLEVRAAAA